MELRKIWVRLAVAAVVIGLLAGVGYAAGRQAGGDLPAAAEPGQVEPPAPDATPVPGAALDTSQTGWFLPYQYEEDRLPRYDQVVAGIELGPNIDGRTLCTAFERVSEEHVAGTPLEISPAFLPAGALELMSSRESSTCKGSPHASVRSYWIPVDEPQMARVRGGEMSFFDARHGARFEVMRLRMERPAFSSGFPSGRFEPGTVAGRPAAIGAPIFARGWGWFEVWIWDEEAGALTAIRGDHLPLADLLALAEGLFR